MPKFARIPVLLLLPMLLTACAGAPMPQLAPVGEVIPDGISLAGRWQLRVDGDAPEGQVAVVANDGPLVPDRRKRGRRSEQAADGQSVHVFLETGSKLKITQTNDGLFISFDRSVVEEYQFREHRSISVGPILADRVSGWVDDRYVIQTLDAQEALLTETYALENDGQQLVRAVTIVYREQETLSLRQVFDRLE